VSGANAENPRGSALVEVGQLQRELERFAPDVAEPLAVGGNANLAEGRGAANCAGARAPLVDHQVVGADQGPIADDERALDDVLELTNVPRPPMRASSATASRPSWRRGVREGGADSASM
jgi:hypothetical protein